MFSLDIRHRAKLKTHHHLRICLKLTNSFKSIVRFRILAQNITLPNSTQNTPSLTNKFETFKFNQIYSQIRILDLNITLPNLFYIYARNKCSILRFGLTTTAMLGNSNISDARKATTSTLH